MAGATGQGPGSTQPTARVAVARAGAQSFFGSRTDVGRVRDHNEDSLLVCPPLFVVADGMGGHAAGEVASEITVDTLADLAPHTTDADALTRAVMAANLNVMQAPRDGKGRAGMGTTCTAAVLEGSRLLIAQVGDSRAYLLHAGRLQQLTRDHSLMADMIESGRLTKEEARFHPDRSVITRAIGSDPHMQPDIYELNVTGGDRLILCSDGLNAMIPDEEIERIARTHDDPQLAADALADAAVEAGGYDNVTVIVVDVEGGGFAVEQKKSRHKVRTIGIAIVLAMALLFAAAGFGFNRYINDSAYLVSENGMVSVYRGVPDTLFGMSFSTLENATDIPVSSLSPGVAARIEQGMQVGSMDEAEELIEAYRQEVARKSAEAQAAASPSPTAVAPSGADGQGVTVEGGE